VDAGVAAPRGIVAFMTDFGSRDPYVGIIRGLVERLTGGRVRLIDLTHEVDAFSVTAGAYVLYTSYRWFPRGTVFLAVVDPGVGTGRKPVAVKTRNYYFVGPDNGLLYPAAEEDGVEEVRVLDNPALHVHPVSASFHGRDVFAPAAAHLAAGVPFEALGAPYPPERLQRLRLRRPCPPSVEDGVETEVVYVDRFGNAALGLERGCYTSLCRRGRVEVKAGGAGHAARCLPVFSHAERGELVFYMNSLGFPELAVNLGSAAEQLRLRVGDRVALRPL